MEHISQTSLSNKENSKSSSKRPSAPLNNPSLMLEFFADSVGSNKSSNPTENPSTDNKVKFNAKQKMPSADSLPTNIRKPGAIQGELGISNNFEEDPLILQTKAKSASYGSIPMNQPSSPERKSKKPKLALLSVGQPGKIINPSQFSHSKNDVNSDESSSDKSDSPTRIGSDSKKCSELDKFLEFKKNLDAESGKRHNDMNLGKFTTFSMKDVRNYLQAKN